MTNQGEARRCVKEGIGGNGLVGKEGEEGGKGGWGQAREGARRCLAHVCRCVLCCCVHRSLSASSLTAHHPRAATRRDEGMVSVCLFHESLPPSVVVGIMSFISILIVRVIHHDLPSPGCHEKS